VRGERIARPPLVNAVRARDTIVRLEGPAELRLQLDCLNGTQGTRSGRRLIE